jgi:hypothetical protein
VSYAGHGPADDDVLPQRIPGATFRRAAATTLRPIDPAHARRVLAALIADRPEDDRDTHPTLTDRDLWGRPHAHGAF